jgi:hypothetical protein
VELEALPEMLQAIDQVAHAMDTTPIGQPDEQRGVGSLSEESAAPEAGAKTEEGSEGSNKMAPRSASVQGPSNFGRSARVRKESWKMTEAKQQAATEPNDETHSRWPALPASEEQCERHPLCNRGFRHAGKGGHCSFGSSDGESPRATETPTEPARPGAKRPVPSADDGEAVSSSYGALSIDEQQRHAHLIRENARRRRNEEGRLKRLGWSYVPRNPGVRRPHTLWRSHPPHTFTAAPAAAHVRRRTRRRTRSLPPAVAS